MPSKMWRVVDLLDWTTGYFQQHSVPNPRLDAEVLLGHLLEKSRLQLYLHFEMPVFQEHLTPFRELIKKRIAHTPVSYLTNRKEFMSAWTSMWMNGSSSRARRQNNSLRLFSQQKPESSSVYWKLGTGSGVIATSLAVQHPEWKIVATDISESALAVARKNAEKHARASHIEFLSGDLFGPIETINTNADTRFDWIVCNPPYIKDTERDTLCPDVRDYEPEIALFAGDDGLAIIRRLIAEAPKYLAPNGKLILEIGATQADAVRTLLDAESGYATYELFKDYAEKERVVLASVS